MSRGSRRGLALLLLVTSLLQFTVASNEICVQVTTCRKNGGTECDRTKEACPPCIYSLQDKYTCWEKDNVTNTCPFTGVKYDCSIIWATTAASLNSTGNATATNGTTTASTATKSKGSNLAMYGAIGGGALILVIIIVVFVVRRRRRGGNVPDFVMRDSGTNTFNTKRGAKAASANTPYANVPDTTKGPNNYQRKVSDPVLMGSNGPHTKQPASNYSGNTASDSLDGMLTNNTPPTAVLGDPMPKTRSVRGISRGFRRINSGGSSVRGSVNSYTQEKIHQDVTIRCTNSANVFDEYLKMKQEMKFDADGMSEYGDETMSLDRFSVNSASTIGGGRTMSIADSEYNPELMRSRGESECFSEMSYNDEKYSFSEEDPEPMIMALNGNNVAIPAAVARQLEKEVEI